MTATPDLQPVEFLAVRYSHAKQGHKPVVGVVELTPENDKIIRSGSHDVMDLLWLERKVFKLNPGNVYSIRTNVERRTFGLRPSWVRQYDDVELAAGLQLAAKAWDMEQAMLKQAAAAGAPTALLEQTLAPLRKHYWNMTEMQRSAFDVWLLRYLRRGS